MPHWGRFALFYARFLGNTWQQILETCARHPASSIFLNSQAWCTVALTLVRNQEPSPYLGSDISSLVRSPFSALSVPPAVLLRNPWQHSPQDRVCKRPLLCAFGCRSAPSPGSDHRKFGCLPEQLVSNGTECVRSRHRNRHFRWPASCTNWSQLPFPATVAGTVHISENRHYGKSIGPRYRYRSSEISRPGNSFQEGALLTGPNLEHLGLDKCL